MSFGQLVIGPPGAGKTTYCHAMHNYLTAQKRHVVLVNLDPANYTLPYTATIDLKELISMEDVLETFQLGPNGGLIYCIEYLEKNAHWLKGKIKEQQKQHPDAYFLFDLPGQVELYTHHTSLRHIVDKMTQSWDLRLTCVHLIDSHHCSDAGKFISVLLLSLSSMTQLELPHVNLLSKMDLIEQYGELEFGLDFYTDVLDLSYLLPRLRQTGGSGSHHPLANKFARLHAALAELIETYNLVSFVPLDVANPSLLANVARVVDKANGCMYVGEASEATGTGAVGSTTHQQQRSLLHTVDQTHRHDINLPDIQEIYMPRTTQEAQPPRRPAAAPTAAPGAGRAAGHAAASPAASMPSKVVERPAPSS